MEGTEYWQGGAELCQSYFVLGEDLHEEQSEADGGPPQLLLPQVGGNPSQANPLQHAGGDRRLLRPLAWLLPHGQCWPAQEDSQVLASPSPSTTDQGRGSDLSRMRAVGLGEKTFVENPRFLPTQWLSRSLRSWGHFKMQE